MVEIDTIQICDFFFQKVFKDQLRPLLINNFLSIFNENKYKN